MASSKAFSFGLLLLVVVLLVSTVLSATTFQMITDQVTGLNGDWVIETQSGCADSPTYDTGNTRFFIGGPTYTPAGLGPGYQAGDVFSATTQIPFRLLPSNVPNTLLLPCGGGCVGRTVTLNTPTLAAGVAFLLESDGSDSLITPRNTYIDFSFTDGSTYSTLVPTQKSQWIGQSNYAVGPYFTVPRGINNPYNTDGCNYTTDGFGDTGSGRNFLFDYFVNFPFLPRELESITLTAGYHLFYSQHLAAITLLDQDFYVPPAVYVPITDVVTGWTSDLILESTTGCADPVWNTGGQNWYFFQSGGGYSGSCLPTMDATPVDIVNSNTGATFRLLPSIGNNALVLTSGTTGTLTLNSATPAMGLSIMVMGVQDAVAFTTRIWFDDATFEDHYRPVEGIFNIYHPDETFWQPSVLGPFSRVVDQSPYSSACNIVQDTTAADSYIFEVSFRFNMLPGTTKNVASIDIIFGTEFGTSTLVVWAVTLQQPGAISSTPSTSFSPTISLSPYETVTITPSATKTKSLSRSMTRSRSATPSMTRSRSATPSMTRSPSATRTVSTSHSASRSASAAQTPSRSNSLTPAASISASRSPSVSITPSNVPPCGSDCNFPIGSGSIFLDSDFSLTCPTDSTSTGTLTIQSSGLDTIILEDVPFSASCSLLGEPILSIVLNSFPASIRIGNNNFVKANAVSGTLNYDLVNKWSGSLSFTVESLKAIAIIPKLSNVVTITSASGFTSSLTGSFTIDSSSSSSGFQSVSGSLSISIPMTNTGCPTVTASSLTGIWTADTTDVESGIAFTGAISSIDCPSSVLTATVTTDAAYSLPGSEGAYSFDTLTLIALHNTDLGTWGGTGSGDGEIAGVDVTLSVSFGSTISTRTVTASKSVSVSGKGVSIDAIVNYPESCSSDFPVAAGYGSITITGFPFGLSSPYTLSTSVVTVLLSCDGSGYWGFTSSISVPTFNAAGLSALSISSAGVVVDFGCPPEFGGWGELDLVSQSVTISSAGTTRSVKLPNTRAIDCSGEDNIQAMIYGNWGSAELILMASYDFNSQQQAVKAVKTTLPTIGNIISAISGSGGSSLGSISTNSAISSLVTSVTDSSSLSDLSIAFNLDEKVLEVDAIITFFGVPVQGYLQYQVTEKVYAIAVGIDSSSPMTGTLGSLITSTLSGLGLTQASLLIANGPVDVELPSTGIEVSLTTKGMIVAAKIDLANNLLTKNVPGFSNLFASFGSFLPSASSTILTATIALEKAPSSVSVSLILSDSEILLTKDGKWVLTSTSLVITKSTTTFSIGIQCTIKLTIPSDDTPFVVYFSGLFSFDLASSSLLLEASATSTQLWKPLKTVEIYVAFPWAISMGINVFTGPVSIGFTGSLKFGAATGSATVYVDITKVANSGFAFALTNFNLRDFLAVFKVTFKDSSSAAKILSSFSIQSLSTSYSLIGYTSPGGSISIPAGFYLSATNVNFFNIVKIVSLNAAVSVGSGFSFSGVIEKTNFGLLKLEHPTISSAGPQVAMTLTPTTQKLELYSKVTVLSLYSTTANVYLDVQAGIFSANFAMSFGSSCSGLPAISSTFGLSAAYSTSWSNPSASFAFSVTLQANLGSAITCLLTEAFTAFLNVAKAAFDAAKAVLAAASSRLAEAQRAFNDAAARVNDATDAEKALAEAESYISALKSKCKSYKCKWYRPDACAAKAVCYAALETAEAALSGLREAANAARSAVVRALQSLASAVSAAQSAVNTASSKLTAVTNSLNSIPGLSDALTSGVSSLINKALIINSVAMSGSASASTSASASFSLSASLVVFGSNVNLKTSASLNIRSIVDQFITQVKSAWTKYSSSFIVKRGDSSLRDPDTGRLILDEVSDTTVAISYSGYGWLTSGKPLNGSIPWTDLCSRNFSELLSINLGQNDLTGDVDACVFTSDVPVLRDLSLRSNKMAGTVNFPATANNVLESLNLENNQFEQELSETSEILNLKSLTFLDLSDNKFSGHIRLFKNFPNLDYLSFSSNSFYDSADYGLANLLLDIPDVRGLSYEKNSLTHSTTVHQPYPYRIHGHIQVEIDYEFFCKVLTLEERVDNCVLSPYRNLGLISDFEAAITKWIKTQWKKNFDFPSSSYLSLVDPSKGETSVKMILPMNTKYKGKNSNSEGGRHTLLSFVYTYPNPNPTGATLGQVRTTDEKNMEEAVRGFLRRMASTIDDDLTQLKMFTEWATLSYSEFSERRSSLSTSDIPLPQFKETFKVRTRKAVLGCPAGWVGSDCQYFCKSGWKREEKYTSQVPFEAAQKSSLMTWDLFESAGSLPTCSLPRTSCSNSKCNSAIYDVWQVCGRWVQDECGNSKNLPGSGKWLEPTNYGDCVDALANADEHCSGESYDCSITFTEQYQELVDEASKKKGYCPVPPKPVKKTDENKGDDDDKNKNDNNSNDKDDKKHHNKEEEDRKKFGGRREEDNNNNNNNNNNGDDDGIAGWAIALIVIACVLGAVIIAAAVVIAVIKAK